MGIYKNIKPEDVSLRSFQVHKEFTFSNTDSGSGVYGIRAISGSVYNFRQSTANSQSFGEYNSISASVGKNPYWATYYEIPTYGLINSTFYHDINVADSFQVDLTHWNKVSSSRDSFVTISGSDFPDRVLRTEFQSRQLHASASVISIPQELWGEQIKPKSVTITDNSTDTTMTLKDDGLGNLYDNDYSSSFTIASESLGTDGQITGSIIGNVMYSHGLIVITDTGSYKDVGNTGGGDGWEVTFKGTQTIYEREIQCNVERGEFQSINNLSITPGYSGSQRIEAGFLSGSYGTQHRLLTPIWPASSSFKTKTITETDGSGGINSYTVNDLYEGTGSIHNFATGSDFSPYISVIGLYDSNNELLAIGKLAKPIRNDKELDMNFIVRFDV